MATQSGNHSQLWGKPFVSGPKSYGEIDMSSPFQSFIGVKGDAGATNEGHQDSSQYISHSFPTKTDYLLRRSSPISNGNLTRELNSAYEQFRLSIHQTAPRFRPWDSQYRSTGFATLHSLVQMAESGEVKGIKGPVVYLDEVMNRAVKARTTELPGNFPFSVKEDFIIASLGDWKSLSEECSMQVKKIMENQIDGILRSFLGNTIDVATRDKARDVVQAELDKRSIAMAEKIGIICAGEERIFTQNDFLFLEYRKRWYEKYRAILLKSGHSVGAKIITPPEPLTGARDESKEERGTPAVNRALASLVELGICVRLPDLVNLLPMDGMDPALQIMAEVRAYIQIAHQRVCDAIPQQIDRTFLHGLEDSIEPLLSPLAKEL